MKPAIYIRCSTEDQTEASQKLAIDRYLNGHSIDVPKNKQYIDKASGDTLDRPRFTDLQSAVFNGEVDTIIVFKVDRISRDLADGIKVLADWLQRGVRIISVTQEFDYSGTIGKMVASLLFGLAEMEQTTRRERQANGIAAARAAGKYIGRKHGSTKAKPSKAKQLRGRGWSDNEIAKQLSVTRRTVQRYLHA